MTSSPIFMRTNITVQPSLRLVDIFEESTEYERNWCLPFNSLCLCVKENKNDPSRVDLLESKKCMFHEENNAYFTTCDTPMRIRYTTSNLHYCIHFRYELFPGVDLFSTLHERHQIDDRELIFKIRKVFQEKEPLRRVALAESAALDVILKFWPDKLPLNISETAKFRKLLLYLNENLNKRPAILEMASILGWSEAYFSRMFNNVFHITPKQYILRELFARSIELLNDPHKSIKQIAGELEFSSEFNFSRFIRRYSGHSPSELRKNCSLLPYVRK